MNRVQWDEHQEFHTYQLGFYPVAGGLPIVVNKQMIGTIGVGGYGPNPPIWSDEVCARTALVEVFGPSVPPLLEDIRENRTPPANPVPVPRFAAAAPPRTTLPAEFVVGPAMTARERFRRKSGFTRRRELSVGICPRLGGDKGRHHGRLHHRQV